MAPETLGEGEGLDEGEGLCEGEMAVSANTAAREDIIPRNAGPL